MDYRDPYSIPLPTTDDEFERLCLLIARERYGADYYRYGRKGQKQHGIDIYSASRNGICLQCKLHKKNITDTKLINELKKDLENSKQKFGDLKQFIFAVSIETRTAIQDICIELSDKNTKVTPWFWNEMQEDIARSKWLLRYYLNCVPGAQWISEDFAHQELIKGNNAGWQPINFYSSNIFAQWYGILKNWDAPRQHYVSICQKIIKSFANIYTDMPVAAIVRGEGGSGKSVLLRRIALDLRNEYTIYWIADNAESFLENEWIYDVENNPHEKYLLVLEDWYRNFSKTDDRITANKLIQKVKFKSNVRLLIGDRPLSQIYYPKSNDVVYDLFLEENVPLFSYITDQIPEWKFKFTEEQKTKLQQTGLFQLLFIYQYSDNPELLLKAKNYFLEIIQSDYNKLCKSDNIFYKGLAQALYIYANLYSHYSIKLSTEAIIVLAESYSACKRPFELIQDPKKLLLHPILKRYLDLTFQGTGDKQKAHVRFLHDTLADEGWKNIEVENRLKFGSAQLIIEILNTLKSDNTSSDLAALINSVSQFSPSYLSQAQIIHLSEFLINIGSKSPYPIQILFKEGFLEISNEQRLNYIKKIAGFANDQDIIWRPIINWLKKRLTDSEQLIIIEQLVEAGNICQYVLVNYYRLLDNNHLRKRIVKDITLERLKTPIFGESISFLLAKFEHVQEIDSVILKFLYSDNAVISFVSFTACLKYYGRYNDTTELAKNYLSGANPYRFNNIFVTCLKLLDKQEIAAQKAREYLQSVDAWRVGDSFITSLNTLKGDAICQKISYEYLQTPKCWIFSEVFVACLELNKEYTIAKEKAREYLSLPDAYINTRNFTACLELLKDDQIAKEISFEYLHQTDAKKIPGNFIICLKILGKEASDVIEVILNSPICEDNHRFIFTSLLIASKFEILDKSIENMLSRIFKEKPEYYDRERKSKFHLYLQVMKVPLFHMVIWQNEVTKLLTEFKVIHRNLFYSLTISHMAKPDALKDACLYFLHNWEKEFSRPKKYWGYFVRSLAHPAIHESLPLQKEIRSLCKEMLLAYNCPNDLKEWLNSIVTQNSFPEWKRLENDE